MFRKYNSLTTVKQVTISVDGHAIKADLGEPVAAVLLRHAPHMSRTTVIGGSPRAPYCMMGACFECLAEIDGVTSTRSCMARVTEGMVVNRQAGRPDPFKDALR
ncbi:(2Fe-2S)-binding protein [Sphingomonas crocodyli]|uniref:(2Fe-2S)-binding protein n=1 Tax=Sphingomonas crocodyli TaxID=1979270 RepID=A0A437M5H7_9SPHN|nr:(2Fe-2S)-binding protein [Sphingomonas crocodyli]RVT92929.1 (2Fe-2S)-binding protein [Sphingomonas crocodyli]